MMGGRATKQGYLKKNQSMNKKVTRKKRKRP
jgi:hypothetical protein